MILTNRDAIEKQYQKYCSHGDGIEKHLPYLRTIAKDKVVCELGVHIGRSSTAFLLAADKLTSVDKEMTNASRQLKEWAGDEWHFMIDDTRFVNLPLCDLLFIDTTHNFEHLTQELKKHEKVATKYMVFHDTITFGTRGHKNWESPEHQFVMGIRPAIDNFQIAHPEWRIKDHRTFGHGLLTLERDF